MSKIFINKNRNVLVFLISIFLLSVTACHSKMQIASLKCDKIPLSDSLMVFQDSLVDVKFYFYENNGSKAFTIKNKTERPVFLDFKNTFIMINKNRLNLWEDVSQFTGKTNQYNISEFEYSRGTIKAAIKKPERIIMIPPKSLQIVNTATPLLKRQILLSETQKENVKANWTSKNKTTVIESMDFTNENTPLKFRIFISLSKTEDFRDPFYFDFNFWLNNMLQMDARQATKSKKFAKHYKGKYSFVEKETEKLDKHPYKKAWRFFIPFNPN